MRPTIFLFLLSSLALFTYGQRSCLPPLMIDYSVDTKPRFANYPKLKNSIETHRKQLKSRYQEASEVTTRQTILTEAQEYLHTIFTDSIIPQWYGTPWDFNGYSEVPREGEIACGYFVSTTLRDVGMRLNRYRLAQQAAAYIVKSLCPEGRSHWFRRKSVPEFVESLKALGPGVYVIGLDFHTGFIHYDGKEVYFLHSSYIEPVAVVKEKALESEALADSESFLVGEILPNPDFVRKMVDGK